MSQIPELNSALCRSCPQGIACKRYSIVIAECGVTPFRIKTKTLFLIFRAPKSPLSESAGTGFSDNLALGNGDPDLLFWCRHQTMNRLDLLSLHQVKLESPDENRQEYKSFSDGEPPSGTFGLACEAKRLVSKVGKLFDVRWTETVRIKPENEMDYN